MAVAGALLVIAVVSTWVADGRRWAGPTHGRDGLGVRAVASRPVTAATDPDLRGTGNLGGEVVALNGKTIVAAVSGGGSHLDLWISLQVDPSTSTVTGAVIARAAVPGYGS